MNTHRRRPLRVAPLLFSGAVVAAAVAGTAGASPGTAAAATARHHVRVLRVGSYHDIRGQYRSVQAAVRAARAGDWVLVGPGDYKEHGYPHEPARAGGGRPAPAGVLITTPDIHLRGMNRNTVIIDGTRPGYPACSSNPKAQRLRKSGWNGVEVYKTNGTWVQNLTVCNYLTDPSGANGGNEIWWNGGQGTGKIGMGSYWGGYLTATSTYSRGPKAPFGDYGIYADNVRGPGSIVDTYASNMGDSAYYIGACPDCGTVIDHAHAEFSALGYSGTNSGGHLIVENSLFDHNKSGLTSNSQNNSDAPSPQSGACPHHAKGPLGDGICFIVRDDVFANNNDANVPGNSINGLAGASPVGTGIVFAGTRNSELYHDKFLDNGAWGALVVDLPDQETPPYDIGQNCQGGFYVIPPQSGQTPLCYYQSYNNRIADSYFKGNGGFGNPSNGDIALVALPSASDIAHIYHRKTVKGYRVRDGDCFVANTDPAGLSTDPPGVQGNPAYACGKPNPGNPDPRALFEAECAAQLLAQCPSANVSGLNYPRPKSAFKLEMPKPQRTMPDPCAGVPVNPWCPVKHTTGRLTSTAQSSGSGGSLAATGSDPALPWLAATATAVGLAGAILLRRRVSGRGGTG
jgi:hypothetical protein